MEGGGEETGEGVVLMEWERLVGAWGGGRGGQQLQPTPPPGPGAVSFSSSAFLGVGPPRKPSSSSTTLIHALVVRLGLGQSRPLSCLLVTLGEVRPR